VKHDIGFRIGVLVNLMNRKMHQIALCQEGGREDEVCTEMQGRIIGFILENQDKRDLFQRDIEAYCSIRRSTATGILQLMEKRGFIKREPVSHDARLKKLVLLPKAIEQHEKIREAIRTLEAQLIEGLTPDELETLSRAIDKMKNNMQ